MKHLHLTNLAITMTIVALTGFAMRPAQGGGQMSGLNTDPAPARVAADASNAFAYDLFAKLRATKGDRTNLFFSPYSISSALTMTYLGARGKTADEMRATLHVPLAIDQIGPARQLPDPNGPTKTGYAALNASLVGDPAKQEFSLSVANSLWGQNGEPFLPDYLDVVKKDFGADLTAVDFITHAEACRQQINDWVASKTQDKIKDLIPPGRITSDTRLVLTNAIYFKGSWSSQFQADRTQKADFSTDRKIQADFMHQTEHLLYAEDDLCQAIEMPYKGDRVSMLVLLPKLKDVDAIRKGDSPTWQALNKLEDSLSAQYVEKLIGQLADRKVDLALPKWHATQSFDLGSMLADMGMKQAFTAQADFSGINGRTDLSISDVIHKAFVTVDETGTEAAAATAVIMHGLAMIREPLPVTFTADHPFVYLIVDDQSHAILFAGRLCDPSAAE
jgi:serpin B